MENAIILTLPIIFFVFGLSFKLLAGFSLLLGISFATYVGITIGPLFTPVLLHFIPEEMPIASHANMLACGVTAAIVFLILSIIAKRLNRESDDYDFPTLIDHFGGALFGGLSGAILTNFIILLILMTPLRSKLPENIDQTRLEHSLVSILGSTLHTIDKASFLDYTESQRQELLTSYIYVPPEAEEDNPKNKKGFSRTPAKTAPQTQKTATKEQATQTPEPNSGGTFFNRIRNYVNGLSSKHDQEIHDSAK